MDTNTNKKKDIKAKNNLVNYYKNIPDYSIMMQLPPDAIEYIKETLPTVDSCDHMLGYFNQIKTIDTTGWNVSNIKNMNGMFGFCIGLVSLDLSKWNTSKVTDMSNMFWNCNTLTALDVSKWNTSKVTDMGYMFDECNSLTNLDVSKWDTSKVTDMFGMFWNCKSLTNLDISNWDTSKVTDMSYMFSGCDSLTTIKGVIDMKSCTSYNNMFYNCPKLKGVKIKNPAAGFEIESGLTKDQYEIVS